MGPLSIEQIRAVFDGCFAAEQAVPEDRARLVRGGPEPFYVPSHAHDPVAQVVYARDLAPSALHEIAHWLCAGKARRCLSDYGYWYVPDGRNAEEQARFEALEPPVQGTECLLALACGVHFRLSADNLSNPEPSANFRTAVLAQALERLQSPAPRLSRLLAACCAQSGISLSVAAVHAAVAEA